MVGSDIDKSPISTNVVNTIGVSTRHIGGGEIVTLNLLGLFVLLIALMEPPEIGLMEPLESGLLRGLGERPN